MSVLRCGDLVFVGGLECGVDDLFPQLDVALRGEGAALADLVELTTFHADVREIDDAFAAAREVLPEPYPAWTPVGMVGGEGTVARAIAHTGSGEKTTVIPDTIAWWRSRPWSAGCRRGDLVAVAGQFGTDTDGDVVMPGFHDGQARNALNRVKEICADLGAGLEDVVDLWSFHQDPRGIEACLDLAGREFFTGGLPTWTTAGAPALYRFGMLGQFRALAGPITTLSIECREMDEALEAIAGLPGTLAEVVSFHKDIRDAEQAAHRAAGAPWTAVCMTGFRAEQSRHAVHALAVQQ
jgi:enamine deaminase RidA (YjgF/YER057c/UK114 family)